MSFTHSPLRYPGGKAALTPFLASVIEANGISDGVYAEPFAGGAGAALSLLFAGYVDRIMINDADVRIAAFWKAVTTQATRFVELIEKTPVTIDEWHSQREIYRNPMRHSNIRLGFATFFLNRCNRSGILMNAGPIGGYNQEGNWKIDARYNVSELTRRIERIADAREHIEISNLDAIDFLSKNVAQIARETPTLVYLDPPYYEKGSELYLNHYNHADHEKLAAYIEKPAQFKWVMTYDNTSEIKKLYFAQNQVPFDLNYSVNRVRKEKELLIYGEHTNVPMGPNELKAVG